jgi:hypothetical protein
MRQTTLFEKRVEVDSSDAEKLVIRALGDFQSRGKELAQRELALDRLRGALRRAADAMGVDELKDEQIAATLTRLGASVRPLPSFVAKHPFRITVPPDLALRALQAYRDSIDTA